MVYNVEQEDSDTEYENATKAMSSSILNYYFPLVNGFLVTLPKKTKTTRSTTTAMEVGFFAFDVMF